MLILMAGLPGTGKSHVARALVERLDAVILSKDTVRHALFPQELIEYSTQQDDFVIDLLLRTTEYIWARDSQKTIILDGRTFSRETQRQQVIAFVERANQEWRIIECVCDDQFARQRLANPDPNHPAGNRTPALYDDVKSRWEPISHDHTVIRTDGPIDYDHLLRNLT